MRNHVLYSSEVTVMDMFCGAGGSSQGAIRIPGVTIRYAINHWDRAIETHNRNFPKTEHVLTDVQKTQPNQFQRVDILIASPECKNHSLAKGKKKGVVPIQLDLPWDGNEAPLPLNAQERSRCTMWEPLKWARELQFNYVILENVVDVRKWQHYQLWLQAWTDLGYEFQTVYLNSMFFHPTPQSRDRWYFVAWRKGNRQPQLDYRPQAYCPQCAQTIGAIQIWKKKKNPWGRYGLHGQYYYHCPVCTTRVQPSYYCAANAIDWTLPVERIGDRKKPLQPKTMVRIAEGLKRFQSQGPFTVKVAPFLMNTSHGSRPGYVYPTEAAIPTQTGRQELALTVPPFTVGLNHQTGRAHDVTSEPAQTMTTFDDLGLCINAALLDLLAEYRVRPILGPASTICAAGNHHALMTFPFAAPLHGGGSTVRALTEALATMCSSGSHHALVTPPEALVMTYYQNGQTIDPKLAALPTATTHDRHGLLTLTDELDPMDCGFRMLAPHEIQAAMAFPKQYVVTGSRREQVAQLGNAVTPPVMEWLVQACVNAMSA